MTRFYAFCDTLYTLCLKPLTYYAFQVVLENLYHDEVWYHVGTGYAAGPVFVVTAVIGHLTSLRNTKTL